MECKQDGAWDLANVKLGALDNTVVELPNNCPPCTMHIVVSYKAAQTTCWELSWKKAYVSILLVNNDILFWLSCLGQKCLRTKHADL